MHYVYVLKSQKDKKYYIGATNDIQRRLAEHNSRCTKSTKSRGPFELIYCEKFDKKEIAIKREKFFKTGDGRKVLKSLILPATKSPAGSPARNG